jgi:hypothetical protein
VKTIFIPLWRLYDTPLAQRAKKYVFWGFDKDFTLKTVFVLDKRLRMWKEGWTLTKKDWREAHKTGIGVSVEIPEETFYFVVAYLMRETATKSEIALYLAIDGLPLILRMESPLWGNELYHLMHLGGMRGGGQFWWYLPTAGGWMPVRRSHIANESHLFQRLKASEKYPRILLLAFKAIKAVLDHHYSMMGDMARRVFDLYSETFPRPALDLSFEYRREAQRALRHAKFLTARKEAREIFPTTQDLERVMRVLEEEWGRREVPPDGGEGGSTPPAST